jgi:cytochrome c553
VALLLAVAPVHAAEVEAGRRKAEPCVPCHGPAAGMTLPSAPALAGQPAFYLHWQLILFRDQRRRDPEMSPFAAKLSDADMADLAAYYAALSPAARPAAAGADPEKMDAGRRITRFYHCSSCHAPDVPGARYTPHITGLSYEYLLTQLRGFKARSRGELDGSTMTAAAQPLTDEDIEILAYYLSRVPRGARP